RSTQSNALSNLFSPPPAPAAPRPVAPPAQVPSTLESAWPRALAEAFVPRQPSQPGQEPQPSSNTPARPAPTAADIQKLRVEIAQPFAGKPGRSRITDSGHLRPVWKAPL